MRNRDKKNEPNFCCFVFGFHRHLISKGSPEHTDTHALLAQRSERQASIEAEDKFDKCR